MQQTGGQVAGLSGWQAWCFDDKGEPTSSKTSLILEMRALEILWKSLGASFAEIYDKSDIACTARIIEWITW